MKESLRKMIGAASKLFLIGLFVVAAAPARAGTMEERINALEGELTQLKGEQAQVKEDALAAKAKLPTFRYKTRGLRITAADKSWGWRMFGRHVVFIYNNTDGNDARGASSMDVFHRRHRVYWQLTWDNSFYDIQYGIDMDTGDIMTTQTTAFYVHFEKVNPFLPTLGIYDKGGPSAGFVARSSVSSAAVEYSRDLNTDSGVDTLSHRGIGLTWNRAPLGKSGTFTLTTGYAQAGTNKNTKDLSDRAQFELVLGARPFSKQKKNKWLKSLKLGINWKTDSVDSRGNSSAIRRIRLRETNRTPRVTLFEARGIGDGQHNYFHWGIENQIGPYKFRVNGNLADYDGNADGFRGVKTNAFAIAHELNIWSPKGFLTGKAGKTGSVLIGYRFAKANLNCGLGSDCMPGGGAAPDSNYYTENEWDIWYWVRPTISVGLWVVHSRSANTPLGTQQTIGCTGNTAADPGKDCDWTSVNMGLRTDW